MGELLLSLTPQCFQFLKRRENIDLNQFSLYLPIEMQPLQSVGVKRVRHPALKQSKKKDVATTPKPTSKLIVYEPPLPVKEFPRLLKDVVPELKDVLSARPPFEIVESERLAAPLEITQRFPGIQSLFDRFTGKAGQRKRVEHDTSETSPLVAIDDDEIVVEEKPKEYYYENIDVRNHLVQEAKAVLVSLTKSQVLFLEDAFNLSCYCFAVIAFL